LSAETGWALVVQPTLAPHLLFLTADGGSTWRNATPPKLGTGSPSVTFLDQTHGWVLETYAKNPDHPKDPIPSALWITADGGRTWATGRLPMQDIAFASVTFTTPALGWLALVANTGTMTRAPTDVYGTRDGGLTWARLGTIPGDHQFYPTDRPLQFLTLADGFFQSEGASRDVMETEDGGATWTNVHLPTPDGIPAGASPVVLTLSLAGSDVHVAVIYVSGAFMSPSYDFVSHDRGASWAVAWITERQPSLGLVPIDATTLLRFPHYASTIPDHYSITIDSSHDAGRSWSEIAPELPAAHHFVAESFADETNGWATIAADQSCPPGYSCPYEFEWPTQLVATSDGGRTWAVGDGH
jgi:photosystem II stability/assembly factor-like uncharacterized protein